ncbi:hypothetical protein ACTA71_000830 [Dictyostelium dimigraforme]
MVDGKQFNSNNEFIFWKVIHNVFLLKLILENVEVVNGDADMFRQIKFKHLTSMEWMLKKKQLELLKCKLNANEYIDLSKIAFRNLFRLNDINNINDKKDQSIEITEQFLKEIINLFFEKKKLELLQFDLLSIALEVENLDHINRKENYEAVRILLNEPFSIKIIPSVFEWAILNCSYQMIEILIESPNLIITKELKSSTVCLAFNRIKNDKESIIRLILNNPKLYNDNINDDNNNLDSIITTTKTKISHKEMPHIDKLLLIKDSKIINQLLNLNYFKKSNDQQFKEMMEIIKNDKSENKIKEILKLLIKKDKRNYENYLLKYFEPIDDYLDIEYFEIIIRYSFSNFEPNIFKWVISKTTAAKEVATTSKVSHHDEIGKKQIKFSIVKQIIEKITIDSRKKDIKRELESTYEFIEFYTKESGRLFFKNTDIDHEIKILLLLSKTGEEYERVYNSISPSFRMTPIPIRSFPKSWNQILRDFADWNFDSSTIVIKNKETFDWIIENCDGILLKGKLRAFTTKELFQFESLELVQYVIHRLENLDKSSILYYPKSLHSDSLFYQLLIYHQIYIDAINNCEIDTLKSIEENVPNFKLKEEMIYSDSSVDETNKGYYFYYGKGKNSFSLSSETTIENQEKLINYLNDSGYKAFNERTFEKFLLDFNFNSDSIKIKFNNQFQQYSSRSYKIISPSFLIKLLNGFSDENLQIKLIPALSKLDLESSFTSNSIFSVSSSEDYDLYDGFQQTEFLDTVYVSRCDQNPKHVIRCIETLIKYFKITSTASETTTAAATVTEKELKKKDTETKTKDSNSMVLQNLINHLFRCFIKIEGVKFEDVENIRRTILENSIRLEHSLFHCFYYLGLKSPKLLQYIIDLPFLPKILGSTLEFEYNSEIEYNYEGYNIGNYLKANIFTWEFIFGSGGSSSSIDGGGNDSIRNGSGNSKIYGSPKEQSFSVVLERLIHEISHLPYFSDEMVRNQKDYLNKVFNYNLEYLLDIKRIDLFFNELEYIKNLLKDKTAPLSTFPIFSEIPKEIQEDNMENNDFKRNAYDEIVKQDGYYIYFYISPFIFKSSLFLMDTHTFSKFVKSYSLLQFIDYLSSIDNFKSTEISEKKVLDLILEHSQLINQVMDIKIQNNNIENKIDDSKSFWENVFKDSITDENTIIKYPDFFFYNDNINLIDLILEKVGETGKFNIVLRELVLKNFPNHSYFQINKELLNQACKSSNVNYINYLYDFGYLNQDDIQFLKLKLTSEEHHPFRFINWLL